MLSTFELTVYGATLVKWWSLKLRTFFSSYLRVQNCKNEAINKSLFSTLPDNMEPCFLAFLKLPVNNATFEIISTKLVANFFTFCQFFNYDCQFTLKNFLTFHLRHFWLVSCPKWLFEKFNILEFKRGVEWGCQRLTICQSVIRDQIKERTKIQQKRPKYAGPIYFHAEVYLEVILESVRNSNKKAQICRPDLFPHGSIFGGQFRERTKILQKRPKFAGPIYFHAEVYLEVILESVRKSNKKGPNLPARFIFPRMYVWKFARRIFVAVFTNFAATLARQPSAASLAPRLNKN